MKTAVLLGIAIAATMVLGVIPAVYASSQGNSDDTKNDFGEQASKNLATDGEMGTHSSDPSGDGTSNPDDRVGIGNVFDQGKPDNDPNTSKEPSDTANRLCAGSDADACDDADDPND